MNMSCLEHSWVVPRGGVSELGRELACAAQSDMPILITGADGDDNHRLAEVIHRRSRRAGAPFVTIDCAAMSESMLESTMFGCAGGGNEDVARGTLGCLERAHCGTLFIANVDAMSARMQARLMQFLENGEIRRVGDLPVHRKVDVRVMTSAECSLFAHTARMSFREDLFYRLNVMHFVLPRMFPPSRNASEH
jgi:DNA-binding NtrC family response regulator